MMDMNNSQEMEMLTTAEKLNVCRSRKKLFENKLSEMEEQYIIMPQKRDADLREAILKGIILTVLIIIVVVSVYTVGNLYIGVIRETKMMSKEDWISLLTGIPVIFFAGYEGKRLLKHEIQLIIELCKYSETELFLKSQMETKEMQIEELREEIAELEMVLRSMQQEQFGSQSY